jgi:hypothetical protein
LWPDWCLTVHGHPGEIYEFGLCGKAAIIDIMWGGSRPEGSIPYRPALLARILLLCAANQTYTNRLDHPQAEK